MERIEAEGGVVEGFIGAIRPPRLEDAGLEDCALPPKSIMEAFSRAAASLKSRVAASFSGSADDSVDGEGGGCVQDPGPGNGQIPDKLLGIGEMFPPALPLCGIGGKEAEIEGAKDDVVIIGAGGGEMDSDRVVVVGGAGYEGGKGGCTGDGELLPGVKNGHAHDGDLDDDDELGRSCSCGVCSDSLEACSVSCADPSVPPLAVVPWLPFLCFCDDFWGAILWTKSEPSYLTEPEAGVDSRVGAKQTSNLFELTETEPRSSREKQRKTNLCLTTADDLADKLCRSIADDHTGRSLLTEDEACDLARRSVQTVSDLAPIGRTDRKKPKDLRRRKNVRNRATVQNPNGRRRSSARTRARTKEDRA
ncbi:hypothetical protein M5K25_021514 [Dendrobium thyrsiflorum]|uniref:Uncharacterized protein n=1 Tax=Dendrobium thyrsiflorum TaxID=117978 RepID=A0ABD0UCT0_DENTH